jgi:competence protein ComFC
MHDLLASVKYGFLYKHIEIIAELIIGSNGFKALSLDYIDVITYVPLSKQRQLWSGFNQSDLVAAEIARFLSKPYCQLLEKTRQTRNQADLDREQRLLNLHNTFRAKRKTALKLDKQHILIIDDVCTTGSTLEECAKALRTMYPKTTVYGLCLTRGD